MTPPRLLLISSEAPGKNMSGPAIRGWHLAQALAAEFPVTLAVPDAPVRLSETVTMVGYDRVTGAELRRYAAAADVLLCSGFTLYRFPFLRNFSQPLIVDLYDPFLFENLQIHATQSQTEQAMWHRASLAALTGLLRRGDFFICASEVQRDFWLGMLAAERRINPQTLAADPSLRQLIDVVAFGLPDEPPAPRRPFLKGVYPGIAVDDKVLYWGGGLWEWFDPLTAIRAMAEIARQRSDVKLFFAGVRHPNPDVPLMRMVETARCLSDQLGLTDRLVFFNDWVPYAARADYLLEADIGLSLHFDNVETRFAYRTRLLDYIWAGLPMVVTRGDVLGGLAETCGLAKTVPPGDVVGVATAVLQWLDLAERRSVCKQRAQALAAELRWSKVVRPLLEFCRNPRRAADYAQQPGLPGLNLALAAKAWQSLRARGVRGLARDIRLYFGF